MGMDVYGKGNDEAYFRASCWSWRPLVSLMQAAGWDVPESWHHNYGEGLDSEEECRNLADAIEDYLSATSQVDSYNFDNIDLGVWVDASGRFLRKEELNDPAIRAKAQSPYSIDVSHVRAWVKFLRECKGFSIF